MIRLSRSTGPLVQSAEFESVVLTLSILISWCMGCSMTTLMVSWSDMSTRAVFAQPPVGQRFGRPRKAGSVPIVGPHLATQKGEKVAHQIIRYMYVGKYAPTLALCCTVGVESRSEECDKLTNKILLWVVTNRYPNVWHPFFLSPWRPIYQDSSPNQMQHHLSTWYRLDVRFDLLFPFWSSFSER
jgi:hypothetical protein